MTPHSLSTVKIIVPKKKREGWIARFPEYTKGTVLPETQVVACPRVKVSEFPEGFIPPKYYERNLEQNQLLAHCCRHPENHEIEARKSHPEEKAPDIYIFYCVCGRRHVRFLLGATDDVARPIWSAS